MKTKRSKTMILAHRDISPSDIKEAITRPDEKYLDEENMWYISLKKINKKWIAVLYKKGIALSTISIVTAFYMSEKKKQRIIGKKLIQKQWRST